MVDCKFCGKEDLNTEPEGERWDQEACEICKENDQCAECCHTCPSCNKRCCIDCMENCHKCKKLLCVNCLKTHENECKEILVRWK